MPANPAGRLVVVVTAPETPGTTSAVSVECDSADSSVVMACRSLCDTCDAGDGSGAGKAVPINPVKDWLPAAIDAKGRIRRRSSAGFASSLSPEAHTANEARAIKGSRSHAVARFAKYALPIPPDVSARDVDSKLCEN